MSAEEDVFEKLDALLRKHHPGAFTSPASKAPVKDPVKKGVVIPLLTDIATPSVMALSPEEQAEIPVLTEVINLAPSQPGEAVIDLDQEFAQDLKSAIALPEENNLDEASSAGDFLETTDLSDDDTNFEHLATGPGIEVPQENMDLELPLLMEEEPVAEEIMELARLIETPSFELIAAEPEEVQPASQLTPDLQAPIAPDVEELPLKVLLPNEAAEINVVAANLESPKSSAQQAPAELAQDLPAADDHTLPATLKVESHLPLIDALNADADADVLIFDEMDDLPQGAPDSVTEHTMRDMDKHLQRLVEEKLGPQLTATMDRALAGMLDQFSTHIEYLVRESVALELQKQLEALRATFTQQLSAQLSNLDRDQEKDQ